MCRHAAYLGPRISLARFALDPAHNMIDQAIHPREMRVGRINADGFGVGWFSAEGVPGAYRNIQPIWSDSNLKDLGVALHSESWIALVRGASPGLGVSIDNTHPFSDDRWHFTLNGIITDFASTLRPEITARLNPERAGAIRGHTDAEFIFALLQQFAEEDPDATTPVNLVRVVQYLLEIAGDVEIALSVLLNERDRLYALRYAINMP
ncbi:MAG: class II glutamine amidotransferase, partial [Pseudomonadota bacterium]